MTALSTAQEQFLYYLDRFVDEESPEMDITRPGDGRTARSLVKLGIVTIREGYDESGMPCLWVKRS